MERRLGKTITSKGYIASLRSRLFQYPLKGENVAFLWPIGNARSLQLLQALACVPHDFTVLNIDLNLDLKANFLSFLEIFNSAIGSEKITKRMKMLTKKRSLIISVGPMDIYPQSELVQILRFLESLTFIGSGRITLMVHFKNKNIRDEVAAKTCDLTVWQNVADVPLPDEPQTKEIITATAQNSGLILSKNEINNLYRICGPRIVLIRSALRKILENPGLRKNILIINSHPDFMLRKKGLETDPKVKPSINGIVDGLTSLENKIFSEFNVIKDGFLSRDHLAKIIWGEDFHNVYSDWAINKTVSRLRLKLVGQNFRADCLKTVRGKGYKYALD
jgi:hypothetical protein